MDILDDFYLVLPSNSSMLFYPVNTTGCYTTQLSREIKLNGDWQVGLAEIHIPCTMMHIQKADSHYSFILGGEDGKSISSNGDTCYFPYGVYDSIEQLAVEINKSNGVSKHQQLQPTDYPKGYWALRRTCDCAYPHYAKFNEKIRRIFGFEGKIHRQTGTFVTGPSSTSVNVGNRPASLARAIPDQLYIYTDICEPYTVGDTQAALLRIVSLDSTKYTFGSNVVRHFAPIHYIPLLHHTFQNIIIDIRDEHGEKFPFEYGTLTITLHFKRNR